MKKIFSKFDKNEKLETHHNTSATNSFVGKVFTVGRVTVTVEDVLAEGKYQLLPTFIIYIVCIIEQIKVIMFFCNHLHNTIKITPLRLRI